MPISQSTETKNRIGFHYYPDTLHYSERDLHTYLPELHALEVSWLTLIAPSQRAIPEYFLNGLLASGIEPILHFHLPVETNDGSENLRVLLRNYARWGVRYLSLFDRPNIRKSWSRSAWSQIDLVERFLDIYLPLAEMSLQEGLTPVFPPLEPGGDYWDTAFLRSALRGIRRRGHDRLLESIVFGAYAFTNGHPLDWGAGGPERWPEARPYLNNPKVQDQRGFRIFDWYLTILQAELGQPRPMLLLKAGSSQKKNLLSKNIEAARNLHTQENLAIYQGCFSNSNREIYLSAFNSDEISSKGSFALQQIDPMILACNFWVLAASEDSPYVEDAWFKPDGSHLPIVGTLREWITKKNATSKKLNEYADHFPISGNLIHEEPNATPKNGIRPIDHYLLLPYFEWGIPQWALERMERIIAENHPTVGFSLAEASLASHVTVIGGPKTFPEEALAPLHAAGCVIERINEDGTVLAQ
jgi:hypothetical protein